MGDGMTADAKPNPLVAGRKSGAQPKPHPMMAHAQMWHAVNSMDAGHLAEVTQKTENLIGPLGALAHKPNLKRTDVIKAAADAAGAGHLSASDAVDFISQLPDKPEELKPFIMNRYAMSLTALVHAKAAQMPDPNGAPQQ